MMQGLAGRHDPAVKPHHDRPMDLIRRTAIASLLLATTVVWAMTGVAAPAIVPASPEQSAAQRSDFTDAEILDGFFKVALNAEWRTGESADRVRRFDGAVRVFIDSRGTPNRRDETAAIVRDIGERIEHLDIAIVDQRENANFIVTLVNDAAIADTIRTIFGADRAKEILQDLDPQCLSGFRRDNTFRIEHAETVVVVDAGDFQFRDCAYEEILQALGPINDDDSLPWSTFNDTIQHGGFTVYDQLILNLLYHPDIRPGMTRAQIEKLAPDILPSIRTFVESRNTQR